VYLHATDACDSLCDAREEKGMKIKNAHGLRWIIASAGFLVALTASAAPPRRASVATFNTAGAAPSSFCTKGGNLLVVHQCVNEDRPNYSTCAIGQTLISGQTTMRVGPGSVSIPAGCYQHSLVMTTVTGGATARSTVWYDPQ
jgi:hypothetical protein